MLEVWGQLLQRIEHERPVENFCSGELYPLMEAREVIKQQDIDIKGNEALSAAGSPMKEFDVFDPRVEFGQAEVGTAPYDQVVKRGLSRVYRGAFIDRRTAQRVDVFFKHRQGHINVDFPLYIAAKAEINIMCWHSFNSPGAYLFDVHSAWRQIGWERRPSMANG
ncbi:hypothetical protein G1E_35045 [Pseudomonas sp. TJI-51]|nr:hypothetical protein G1E_35045 [Pseudomonas sp. TJI-51]